jgi:hypothetical protein
VSNAYYGLFHLLIADFVGRARLGRMFEHRRMSQAVTRLKGANQVGVHLQKVIDAFAQLQQDRYTADYDIGTNWTPVEVKNTFKAWRAIRKETIAQDHLLTIFGARRA